jgi:uncharacterized membrane protein YozB (DUF420 family)
MSVSDLPALNATLNATAAILLTIGWVLIRSGRIAAHRRFMIWLFVSVTGVIVYLMLYQLV